MDDKLIQRVCSALELGKSESEIHDDLIVKGYSEDYIFLIIKAASVLLQGRYAKQKELEELIKGIAFPLVKKK